MRLWLLLLLFTFVQSDTFCPANMSNSVNNNQWTVSVDVSQEVVYFVQSGNSLGYYSLSDLNLNFTTLQFQILFIGAASVTLTPSPTTLGFPSSSDYSISGNFISTSATKNVIARGNKVSSSSYLYYSAVFSGTGKVCVGFASGSTAYICPGYGVISPKAVCTPYFCYPCDCGCFACFGPGPGTCTSCQNGYYLQPNSYTCSSVCPAGYYPESSNNECVQCSSSCQTCTGPLDSECSSCSTGLYMQTQGHSNYCQYCAPECNGCVGGTEYDCISCKSGHFLQPRSTTCNTTCPLGYFTNTTNNSCESCYPACDICVGTASDQCVICSPGYFLQPVGNGKSFSSVGTSGVCLSTCNKTGYYADYEGNLCSPCSVECEECFGPSVSECTICAYGVNQTNSYFLQPNSTECANQCPIGYYGNTISKACELCNIACTNCTDDSTSTCKSCNTGYYLQPKGENGSVGCSDNCPVNYWQSSTDNVCIPCYQTCSSCSGSGSTECTSCAVGLYFQAQNGTCTNSCPDGFYADNSTKTCENCHLACRTCQEATADDCTSCKNGFFLEFNSSSCKLNCTAPHYYAERDQNICASCDSTCADCTGPQNDQCIACSGGLYLQPLSSQCLVSCPDGYAKDTDTSTCQKSSNSSTASTNSSNNTTSSSTNSSAQPQTATVTQGELTGGQIGLIVVGSVLGLAILLVLIFYCIKRRQSKLLSRKGYQIPSMKNTSETL